MELVRVKGWMDGWMDGWVRSHLVRYRRNLPRQVVSESEIGAEGLLVLVLFQEGGSKETHVAGVRAAEGEGTAHRLGHRVAAVVHLGSKRAHSDGTLDYPWRGE